MACNIIQHDDREEWMNLFLEANASFSLVVSLARERTLRLLEEWPFGISKTLPPNSALATITRDERG